MRLDLRRPRILLVTRKTPLTLLLEQHGTLAQARFYLESRGQTIAGYELGILRAVTFCAF